MHEINIFDKSWQLKKIISATLEIRSKQQMETPFIFRRNKKGGMPWSKSITSAIKKGTA